jgi:hypothetical protein
MINATFKTLNGRSPAGVLSDNFTLQEFRGLIERLLGKEALTEWSYLCKGKQLRMEDETLFNAQKKHITNGCTIQVTRRSKGGSTYMPAHTFAEKFVADVNRALGTMTNSTNATCPICLTSGRQCLQISCSSCSNKNVLCKDCFIAYLKISDLRYRCLFCHKNIGIMAIFPNVPELRVSVDTFNEMGEIKRNIDCQICRCGEAQVSVETKLTSSRMSI